MQEFLPYIEMDGDIEAFRVFCLQHCYRKESVHKGEVVIPPEHNVCGFLHKGCLKVFFSTEHGTERLMWFLEDGNLIPTGSGKSFYKRLVADVDSEILYITFDDIYQFVLQSKKNFFTIVEQYQKRQLLCIQGQLKEIEESSGVKILKFLFQSAALYGKRAKDGILIENLPSRSDIASHIGVHRSNVTRYISNLEKDGVLEKVGKKLLVKDLDRLEKMLEAELEKD